MSLENALERLYGIMSRPNPGPYELRPLIRDMLTTWVEQEAPPRAVLHPLGFLYIPLIKRNGRALRLHIWPADSGLPAPLTSPYHRHSWNLISYVVTGTVINEMPLVACAGQQAEYRLYDIDGTDGVDRIAPTSITVVKRSDIREEHAPGSLYRIPAGEFHATTCTLQQLAATVCLAEDVEGCTEVTLGPLDGRVYEQRRDDAPADMTLSAVGATLRMVQ